MLNRNHSRIALIATLAFVALVLANPPHGRCDASQQGSVSVEVSNEVISPGQRLDVSYTMSPGTLQDTRVDIYFSVLPPGGPLAFFRRGQGFSETPVPLRSNVKIREKTRRIFSFYPLRLAFGTYTYSIVFLYAGKTFEDDDAFASAPASASVTFDPLSEGQRALIDERGNPDLLTVTWLGAMKDKQDTWYYYSDEPTKYDFTNGELTDESPISDGITGDPPRLSPHLLTPQTTLDELTAVLGPPISVTRFVEGNPAYQGVSFAMGLDVVFRNQRLTFATTSVP